MQPAPGKDIAALILRVEGTQASLNVDINPMFCALVLHLPGGLKQKLKASIKMSYV